VTVKKKIQNTKFIIQPWKLSPLHAESSLTLSIQKNRLIYYLTVKKRLKNNHPEKNYGGSIYNGVGVDGIKLCQLST